MEVGEYGLVGVGPIVEEEAVALVGGLSTPGAPVRDMEFPDPVCVKSDPIPVLRLWDPAKRLTMVYVRRLSAWKRIADLRVSY